MNTTTEPQPMASPAHPRTQTQPWASPRPVRLRKEPPPMASPHGVPRAGTLADVYLRMLACADLDTQAGAYEGAATWREAAAMIGDLL